MLWGYYSMLRNVVQLVLNAIVNVFLNAILNIFEIWSVLFGLFFWFYNAECLSVYNCILKVFSSDDFLLFIYIICCLSFRLSPLTCCVSCSSPRLFAHVLCNSPYRLKQAQNMSGSVLLTTEASQLSVGIAENCYIVFIWKFLGWIIQWLKRIAFWELLN